MVDVSSQNNSVSINVSSSGNSASIKASPDTAQYYSEKSREWAISNRIVDGVDYSSKYYAQQSGANAQKVVESENKVKEIYNTLLEESSGVSDGIREVGNEALTNIETVKNEAIDSIKSSKTTILNDIEFVADGEKKEIEDLIYNGKEELKESIGDIKVLTTLEIGDIGIAPLGIDETKGKRRYLNGQLIIQEQYVQFTDKVKSAIELYPSLACTESEWQTTATMTVGGQVGKFVVDDEAGTIRLPKIIMPIQGLTNLSKLGEIVKAGLPNITGVVANTTGYTDTTTTGFVTRTSQNDTGKHTSGAGIGRQTLDFDASRSSSIYGNSNTVQQEQIQYPYFIQVATGAETEDNIINEIELNNPFSLLDYKYSEYELNNLSWLRSNGQWSAKAVYPAVYELLLKIYNGTETKAGVSVKLATGSYTDYDFVLNTAEETFRLPVKVKLASGKAVIGNGMSLGLTNGNKNVGLTFPSGNSGLSAYVSTYGLPVSASQSSQSDTTAGKFGITTDPTKSGIETSDQDLYLYFYVGETVQNANLINAGRIEEQVISCLTRSNKEEIINWGLPDYTKGIGITFTSTGFTYTAPANGFISVQTLITANGVGEVKINGVTVLRGNSGTKDAFGDITGQVVVRKGDVITTTTAYSGTLTQYNWATFYPMKGAN